MQEPMRYNQPRTAPPAFRPGDLVMTFNPHMMEHRDQVARVVRVMQNEPFYALDFGCGPNRWYAQHELAAVSRETELDGRPTGEVPPVERPGAGMMMPQAGMMMPQAGMMMPQAGMMMPQAGMMMPPGGMMMPPGGMMLGPGGMMVPGGPMIGPAGMIVPQMGTGMFPGSPA